MLHATTPAASVSPSPAQDGIDNREVLEFLQLVQELNGLAALLAIRPATSRRRGKASRNKRLPPS